MRSVLVAATAFSLALAEMPAPHKLAITRVFPQPGQIGIFIAAADGSDERPLLASADAGLTIRSGLPTANPSSSPPTGTGRPICFA